MKALITGITGQDGSYLKEHLQSLDYEVIGLVRRVSGRQTPEDCICCDITDASAVAKAVSDFKPDEVYNLAAMSHVGESFKQPALSFQVNAAGAINVLIAARDVGAKFYQASTSELFGSSSPPQSISTPFHPRSPYGVAKIAAHWATVNSREAYGHFACCGILFNHESPRRGRDFVTQKVVRAAAKKERVTLGNLNAVRDWGHADDYVVAMHLMLQQDNPVDYVVATGVGHTVKELCEEAYSLAGLDWQDYVVLSDSQMRPADVDALVGDPSEIKRIGWLPKHDFKSLIRDMYNHALHEAA